MIVKLFTIIFLLLKRIFYRFFLTASLSLSFQNIVITLYKLLIKKCKNTEYRILESPLYLYLLV